MPVHDETSHSAAAAGTFFEAHRRGMLEGVSGTALESRSRSGRGVTVITRLTGRERIFYPSPDDDWDWDDDRPRVRVIR